MRQARKDHACLLAEINGDKGILVSGGVDENDALLNSVEFYSLRTESWTELSELKNARTEHGEKKLIKEEWIFVFDRSALQRCSLSDLPRCRRRRRQL
jgi:hypothetical protein